MNQALPLGLPLGLLPDLGPAVRENRAMAKKRMGRPRVEYLKDISAGT